MYIRHVQEFRGHSRSLKMVPFESLGTVSYSYSTATMAVSLAVSTQYTNVTDTRPDTAQQQQPQLCSLGCVGRQKTVTYVVV